MGVTTLMRAGERRGAVTTVQPQEGRKGWVRERTVANLAQAPPLSSAEQLVHVLATVDGNVGTCHEGGFVRAQVDNESGDLLGLAQS